jgi:hypothetical protein
VEVYSTPFVVISDTFTGEVIPSADPGVFPVHGELMAKYGVYILEVINTAELARDEAYEFLFVFGQPKVTGAVQMIINPIAIR